MMRYGKDLHNEFNIILNSNGGENVMMIDLEIDTTDIDYEKQRASPRITIPKMKATISKRKRTIK